MQSKTLLVVCILAVLAVAAMGETAVDTLKAKVNAGEGAAPCDKAAPAGPAPPRQFLDQRLPHVVDDYHPPVGGFNPTDIPSKEVDVAARKILREIQAAEAEAKANGDAPAAKDDNGVISTEEHKALKQLLLDADILVRAANKALGENGPVTLDQVKKVAKSAVKKAAKAEKKAAAKKATIAAKKLAAAGVKAVAPAAATKSAKAKAKQVGAVAGDATKSAKAKQVRSVAPTANAKSPKTAAKAL